VSCWNACCHGADVTLTPYDILRLSGLRPAEFLKRCTVPAVHEASHMPVVKLKMHMVFKPWFSRGLECARRLGASPPMRGVQMLWGGDEGVVATVGAETNRWSAPHVAAKRPQPISDPVRPA